MSDETSPTPLPWYMSEVSASEGGIIMHKGPNGIPRILGRMYGCQDVREDHANARLACEAVNAHARLARIVADVEAYADELIAGGYIVGVGRELRAILAKGETT